MSVASPSDIDAARAYETLFVPALFGAWAPKVADAAQLRRGWRVLDVACGTGVLAREAATRVQPEGAVTGVDIAAGMLAVARELAPAIAWREGRAEALPFADATFDAVVSQFGLMLFADRGQALREMIRVARPGATLAVAVWNALDRHPLYEAEVALLDRLAGERAAAALRAPFSLGDRDALASSFAAAGAASVAIDTRTGTARFPGVRVLVEADLRGWLPVMGARLDDDAIGRVLAEADGALSPYVTRQADGAITFPMSAHIVTARAPA